ncbi:MAG TPA: PAS domain-containing protein, partial [Nitrospiria bacterium]|nr:PAS domain-containing protein [Nitrospiria bacterium]
MHVTVYGGSDFLESLFTPDLHELQKRLLVCLLLIAFSVYAQRSVNARRRTESDLADREREQTLILETNPAAILLVDAESRRVSWANANALQMIGAPEEIVIGQVCHKHLCPTEIGNCPILDRGQSAELAERILLTGAGRQVPILKSVARVEYRGREHLLEAFFDVSDRKKMWLDLKQAHAELDQIFQTASVGMRLVDVHYNVLRVNRTYESLTGMKEADAVGKKCHESFPGSGCFTEECPVRRIMNGERVITEFQVDKKLPDGREIVCLIDATPFAGADGEIIGVVESFRDITELMQARNAVAGERDKLQRILSNLPKGVGIINKDRILEYPNPVFRDYFGEAFGQRCHRVIYGKDQPCEPCLLEEALSTGQVQYAERTTDDGRTF